MRPDVLDPAVLYAPGSPYHVARRWTAPHTLRCLRSAVALMGTPASVLDVGCGEGALVRELWNAKIDAMGVDLCCTNEEPMFRRVDLRVPLELGRQFEWVLCWEVGEHLPESSADILVDTLVRHMDPAGRMLFTAAPPGQKGPGHITLRNSRWWLEKFYEHGLVWAEQPTIQLTKAWKLCAPKASWYWNNLIVLWRPA